ncbi:universal stress protein PHOS32-like isoform X1 [Rosa rugosa]|uniref:universal stress protein PHOS32-like isoform X1 n=1 Tax=Rosa rugosa TaxID=74645 RepID=UPI002B40B195|nr:universal stress protein PHOS32-like isoform X1 [Rosa rugosa]
MNPPAVPSQPSSPLFPLSPSPHRKVAIAVDLSDESAYAVRWAAEQYLRPGDAVVLLHVRPTSVLYGADWGWVPVDYTLPVAGDKKSEDDLDALTTAKTTELARPLVEAGIEFKIHIVKDRDMKERLCLEVERLGLSAVIMGSRGFGAAASKRSLKMARLGSVSDYCVQHCVCPVVVVRCPDDVERRFGGDGGGSEAAEDVLLPVPEEDQEDNEDGEPREIN